MVLILGNKLWYSLGRITFSPTITSTRCAIANCDTITKIIETSAIPVNKKAKTSFLILFREVVITANISKTFNFIKSEPRWLIYMSRNFDFNLVRAIKNTLFGLSK